MLIVMKQDATQSDIERVVEVIEKLGFRPHAMPGAARTAIGITGNQGAVDPTHFENLPGVAEAIRVTKPYKLISKTFRPEKSIIKVGNRQNRRRRIGNNCRTVRGRNGRTGFSSRRIGCQKRREIFSRRRIQTANFAVCFSGKRRRRFENFG